MGNPEARLLVTKVINSQANIANDLANTANYVKILMRMERKYCMIAKDTSRMKTRLLFYVGRGLMMNTG